MSKVYVGNLPYNIDGDQLKTIFEEVGEVISAIIISDRQTQQSKGFGFVEFGNDEDRDKAIQMFNEKDYEGRVMRVSEARPQEPRPQRSY